MKYYVLFLLMLSMASRAQVWEDFSDGELSHDPAWSGETEKFKFSSSSAVPAEMRPALQLNCDGAGTAWISTQQLPSPEMQWELWIKLSFNSSASNFARVYLSASQENPVEGPGALFIQAGGGEDSVWLGRADTSGVVRLYTLPVLYTGNSTNALRLKVVREAEGLWHFFGNASGELSLDPLGDILLPDSLRGGAFALYCEFTSSNATKFYFDDLYCGPRIIDSTGPVLLQATVPDPAEVLLLFDEAVGESSAGKVSNYRLSGGLGHPYEAFRMLDPATVALFFEQEMEAGALYELTAAGVADAAGNIMDTTVTMISWYRPGPYDVIIHEIMADPNPQVMLPAHEYIELFNRTGQRIDLDGWKLDISGHVHMMPAICIDAEGYLLLMSENALPEFKFCGPATGFSSFSISNEGAWITLSDKDDRVICHTEYHPDKFLDNDKSEGGWSLERTDPFFPCSDETAWAASSNPAGGTPGSENSTVAPAMQAPGLLTLCCTGDSSLSVRFNMSMNCESMADPSHYDADHGLGHPAYVEVEGAAAQAALLHFDRPLNHGTPYRLTVNAEILDCIGNPIAMALSGHFSPPSPCQPLDIIFNELLFHPLSDGAEYIELFNRSERTVHLDELVLAYVKESPPNPPDTGWYDISANCLPVSPGDYIVLTKYPEKVLSHFYVENSRSMHKMSPFPLLGNEEGTLLLLDRSGHTVDGLDYSADMHYPLLGSCAGVALERVCTEPSCTGPGNWHSASSSSGYGTPGSVNSQYRQAVENEDVLHIDPQVFSPDGDGKEDVMGISCTFGEPGMLISISIFSEDGRLVRRLVNTALAGTKNTFYWDGLTDRHYPAPAGIYVVLLETVSMNGYSRSYRKAAALVG